jgi:hypothetical protein
LCGQQGMSNRRSIFWFSFSLAVATIYALMVMHQAFDGDYVVQDDVRQHVFWMQRFVDPQLFPNDLIADYFQSVSPWGFTQFYRLFAAIGIHPLLLSKILPAGLSLVAAAYAFGVGMQILPVPFAGFLSSLLTTQVLWVHDDVASATPRAFLPPLFLAFLYYLLRRDEKPAEKLDEKLSSGSLLPRSLLPCLGAIVLQGLFYPQYVLVFAGVVLLRLVSWQQGKLRLTQSKSDYWFVGACLGASVLVLLPIVLSDSGYGPVVSLAEARQLPEFSELGRTPFFLSDPAEFWLWGDRSGLFPAFRPRFLAIGFLLPLVWLAAKRYPTRFPMSQQVSRKAQLLWQIVVVAIALFAAAHLLLFRLYLPSRYSTYTLRFVLVFATAIVLTLLLDALWQWLRQQPHPKFYHRLPVWGVTLAVVGTLLLYPNYSESQAEDSYSIGDETKLYKFFAQQPKESVIASLAREVDNFPTFSGRSILIGREYALPYQVGYARQFRQRAIDTINAQYSLDPAVLKAHIQTYRVNFWVINRQSAFQPALLLKTWIKQYPEAFQTALTHLQQGTPVLKTLIRPCTLIRDQDLQVLSAQCMLQRLGDRG